MSRSLQIINLLGVLGLAALCAFQWRTDRRLNIEINRLEKVRIDQEQRIAEQKKQAEGLSGDLEMFKRQFHQTHTELQQARDKIRGLEQTNGLLGFQVEQLQSSITNWANAVAGRDALIKEANGRITDLSDQLNDSIRKFNALASNYNTVVGELNAARAVQATNTVAGK